MLGSKARLVLLGDYKDRGGFNPKSPQWYLLISKRTRNRLRTDPPVQITDGAFENRTLEIRQQDIFEPAVVEWQRAILRLTYLTCET